MKQFLKWQNSFSFLFFSCHNSPLASYGEGFAERAYDGENLRPRDKPGAVIHDPEIAAQQAVMLAVKKEMCTLFVFMVILQML